MVLPSVRSVALMAGLLWACSSEPAFQPLLHAAPPPDATQPASPRNRSVTFDFAGLDASGDIRIGNPLKLSLTLNGAVQGHAPLVAICESIHFERQIVTMEPDSRSTGMHATAVLEPIAPGKLSVTPTFARIQVTFARAQTDKKLDRVMTRIVYVTFGEPTQQNNTGDLPPPRLYELNEEDAGDDDPLPDATPIATTSLVEETLLPFPAPGQGPGPAYWQYVSALLSQSWSHTAHLVRRTPMSEVVHVRFRMYPNGRAQLIQIEKGSGSRLINEAGIYAVVQAQPFPPFPEHVGSEPVDVHVRMRTGARADGRQARPVSIPQAPQQDASTLAPKQ